MDEFKDQLPSEDVTKMKEKITEVRAKLEDKENMDPEAIKETVNDLQQSSLKVGIGFLLQSRSFFFDLLLNYDFLLSLQDIRIKKLSAYLFVNYL